PTLTHGLKFVPGLKHIFRKLSSHRPPQRPPALAVCSMRRQLMTPLCVHHTWRVDSICRSLPKALKTQLELSHALWWSLSRADCPHVPAPIKPHWLSRCRKITPVHWCKS